MTKNQLKNETNILALLYMQLIYRLFREQQTILALYLINLSSIVSASAGSDEISETVDSGGSNCKKEALNEDKTAKFCSGLYYYNARWYDPQIGRFTTEDPIRAGLNYFIYANNNPLKYVDPTGLIAIQGAEATTGHIDIDIDTGTPVEISAREASVKGDFPYMKGYGLLDQEISDYSELGDLKNEMAQYEGLGGADGAYYSDLKSQYDTKLNDSLHLQKELNPDGSDACAYRTAQAGIEVGLGRPMPLDMINKSTTDIRHKGLSMTTLSGTRPGSEYNVDNFRAVMDSALNSLGRGDLRSQLGSSNNAEWSFNIAKGRTANNGIHFNLANSGKNHVWDSMTGSTNYISSESRYIPFSVISR